ASDFTSRLGAGVPLDSASRSYFEPRFGRDFSSVRVHADEVAARSAAAINALAYTAGHDVVFGVGQFSPTTPTGRQLLAHELVHVVQQSGTGSAMIQRACGPEIREISGCAGQSDMPVGERFLFVVGCDDLLPGELPRLLAFSRTISNGDRLIIHGNASEEGDAQFNENLSCYRAHKAQDLL